LNDWLHKATNTSTAKHNATNSITSTTHTSTNTSTEGHTARNNITH
jgi:hypothetical protein